MFRKFGEVRAWRFRSWMTCSTTSRPPIPQTKPVVTGEGKVTLPLIAALRNAGAREGRQLRALAARKRWTLTQWEQLKTLIEQAGGFAYARQRAEQLAAEARDILAVEPVSPVRRALEAAVHYSVRRTH
jgi:octaprenyl-diphosphate synthase